MDAIKRFVHLRFLKTKKEEPYRTARDIIVQNISGIINDYVTWHSEHGLFMPPDFATDPTSWLIVLSKMKRSFSLLEEELREEGELWEAKNKWKKFNEQDTEKIEELNAEIVEGLTLFGKYLFYLTEDQRKKKKE